MLLTRKCRGFTVAELLVTIAIMGILAGIAVPSYSQYRDRVDIAVAMTDIQAIEHAIERFRARRFRFPGSLADIDMDGMLDPWGNPYQYLNIADSSELDQRRGMTGTGPDMQKMRRDRNLRPINSDYDLYSSGKDGASKPPLNARESRDDVIRASDGKFVGLAEEY